MRRLSLFLWVGVAWCQTVVQWSDPRVTYSPGWTDNAGYTEAIGQDAKVTMAYSPGQRIIAVMSATHGPFSVTLAGQTPQYWMTNVAMEGQPELQYVEASMPTKVQDGMNYYSIEAVGAPIKDPSIKIFRFLIWEAGEAGDVPDLIVTKAGIVTNRPSTISSAQLLKASIRNQTSTTLRESDSSQKVAIPQSTNIDPGQLNDLDPVVESKKTTSSNERHLALIIGTTLGAAFFLLSFVCLFVCCRRRKGNKEDVRVIEVNAKRDVESKEWREDDLVEEMAPSIALSRDGKDTDSWLQDFRKSCFDADPDDGSPTSSHSETLAGSESGATANLNPHELLKLNRVHYFAQDGVPDSHGSMESLKSLYNVALATEVGNAK